MSKTHGGKGSDRRASQISKEEEDLRWELIKAKPAQKRAIICRLNQIRNTKKV